MTAWHATSLRRRSTRAHGTARAFGALLLSLWSIACTSYAPRRADQRLAPATRVRLAAATPFAVRPPAGAADSAAGTLPVCQVTFLEGDLERTAGDTLVFRSVERVTAAVPPVSASEPAASRTAGEASRCGLRGPGAVVVRTTEMALTQRGVSGTRTTLLLVGIAAVLVGLAGLAASGIETGFPSSGGTSY